ncbi:hypothetical protein F2Q70_00017161 [Brassica cretica]|uniref:Uncharacterized protein n=1 Tax=Brassica cretica TaxID=69181 RepID=A0A8S9I5Y1_BRACR|nr:hypothetical protein F2Q70_00017161 [Brassica cretica]
MTSPLKSICCSRTIRIRSMSCKKPIWNQFKNYHPNPNVRNNPHIFSYKTNPDNPNDRSQGNQFQNTGYQKPYFQNQNQNGKMFILSQAQNQFQNRQNNPHAAPATASSPPDVLKGMMQQLLQGQQIQGKALNQVTTEINTRMDNMFTKLNSKYDAVASHIRQMDVQIAQTTETIKRQQGTLPGKTYKNPKDYNAIDDLAAKVDLLLKNNQNQIYVMEETNLEPGTTDAAAETETSEEDQQEGNQFQNTGYQKSYFQNQNQNQNQNGKMFILSQAHNQFQNRQNNLQAAPATASGPPDELKGMMQQLLQGQQIQGKSLNQVTTEINTRMDNMFTELNSKYDAILSPRSSLLKRRENRKRELEDVHDDDHEPEQPTTAEPVAPMTPDRPVPTRVYTPKVPYPVPAKKSHKDCEEMK